MRVFLALILAGCSGPGVTRDASVEEVTEDSDLLPRDAFPLGAVGCYQCSVVAIHYRGEDEPLVEEDISGASVRIGSMASNRPTSPIAATVEGCPFYITRARQPNPSAFRLAPNVCDGRNYQDNFVLVRSDVLQGEHVFRTLPSGEAVDCEYGVDCDTYESTEWWITLQINSDEQVIRTYDCWRSRCLR